MRVLHAATTLALVAIATSSMLEASTLEAETRALGGASRVPPGGVGARRDWSATLSGRDGRKVTGSATARPTADGKGTDISVTIDGDTPGAVRPWHVHTGSCQQAGGVVGGGRAYKPISVDIKGHATATATIPALLADTATYYVNIHDAAAAMNIIVACGDLQKK